MVWVTQNLFLERYMSTASDILGVRSSFLHFLKDPFYSPESESYQYLEDGLMVVENGKVKELGPFSSLTTKYTNLEVVDYDGKLVIPGFIDTHLHYPQTEIVASYGQQLLEWLDKFTFPAEAKFKDKSYAETVASFFLNELLRNGTTTALVFGSVHSNSIEVLFEEADRRQMRMIAGKVLMDRKSHVPAYLLETAEQGYEETQDLIEKWHGKRRLLYAVTPRFAVTSSEAQLQGVSQLMKEYPSVYMQTHLSENLKEGEEVFRLYPQSKGYLDVYDHFGLLGSRSIFAHGVHLCGDEFKRLSETSSSIAFCPTSNLFLGSGLFKLHQATSLENPIKLGLGTDIGGGTSFSMLKTMSEAYKVGQLQGHSLSAFKAFYLSTLGGAKALSLENQIGNFSVGKEADFIVLDLKSTAFQAFKRNSIHEVEGLLGQLPEKLNERLFTLMILGDDRAIEATYVYGQKMYQRKVESGQFFC